LHLIEYTWCVFIYDIQIKIDNNSYINHIIIIYHPKKWQQQTPSALNPANPANQNKLARIIVRYIFPKNYRMRPPINTVQVRISAVFVGLS
jgi:hypothetical protein